MYLEYTELGGGGVENLYRNSTNIGLHVSTS